ncbi:hypothetical protein D3C84_967470 [compost metagenome]
MVALRTTCCPPAAACVVAAGEAAGVDVVCVVEAGVVVAAASDVLESLFPHAVMAIITASPIRRMVSFFMGIPPYT